MKIKLQNVRLSFPSLYRKAVFNGETTKFEATFLLHKERDADKIAEIQKAIAALAKEKLKGKKLKEDKLCLRDGDDAGYDGYDGHMSLKASSSKRPLTIDRDKSVLTEDDDKLYAGCFVNTSVQLWAQNNSYGQRINAGLLGVQFFKHGEPFGSGEAGDPDDFDDFDDDDDDDLSDFN